MAGFVLTPEELRNIHREWLDGKAEETLTEAIARAQRKVTIEYLDDECDEHWDPLCIKRWDCQMCRQQLREEVKG